MKIFVTGGAGFIGSNFIRFVLDNRPAVSVLNYDQLTYAGNLANLQDVAVSPRYRFVQGDIRDLQAVLAAMGGCDCVVHFAAESHVDRSIYDPSACVSTNVLGTSVLLQAARRLQIKRFIHISTDEVYGDLGSGQVSDEAFPLRPSSPYAASKASSDLLVNSYIRTYDFPPSSPGLRIITAPINSRRSCSL
jgi:dTDP-glucose 4,6-dehydratase